MIKLAGFWGHPKMYICCVCSHLGRLVIVRRRQDSTQAKFSLSQPGSGTPLMARNHLLSSLRLRPQSSRQPIRMQAMAAMSTSGQ